MSRKKIPWNQIDPKERLMFIHIPKTGGTWVKKVMMMCGLDPHKYNDIGHNAVGMTDQTHAVRTGYRDAYVKRHPEGMMFSPSEDEKHYMFDDICKFTVVRNPFDYLVSLYHHDLPNEGSSFQPYSHGPIGFYRSNLAHDCRSFKDFVIKFTNPELPWCHRETHQFLFWQIFDQFIPGRGITLDRNDHEKINASPCEVDIVVYFENLAEHIKMVMNGLGLMSHRAEEFIRENDALNRSATRKKKDYRLYYDSEMIERVQSHCARELEIFGYDFNGPTRDISVPAMQFKRNLYYGVRHDVLLLRSSSGGMQTLEREQSLSPVP